MYKRFIYLSVLLFILLLGLALGACAQAGELSPEPGTSEEGSEPTQIVTSTLPAEPVTLRIALLPILDNLPMFVAKQEGLFEKRNLNVEFIPVGSAAERDQVIVAGQADGMINETISTLLYNKDEPQVQIVGFSRTATPESSQYSILANGQSGITTPQDLKGVEIGVSEGTIIEYITTRLLEAEGLSADEIKKIAVPKIADRMTLLGSGELKAATLPDPLSTLAIQQGAVVVVDDSKHPEYGYSTYSFLIPVIKENPEAIRAFLEAVAEATDMIAADSSKWNNLLSENNLVPASLIESFKLPPFPEPSVPSEEQWNDAIEWAKEKGIISQDVSYSDSVNPSFLP